MSYEHTGVVMIDSIARVPHTKIFASLIFCAVFLENKRGGLQKSNRLEW